MASYFSSVLSSEDIQYINQLPEVLEAKARLRTSDSVVYFSINLTTTIRSALLERLGLDLSNINEIPMRWIKGDTAPHVDTGRTEFNKTHLMYLNNSPGELVLDGESYPIAENTAFVFSEGISHETVGTGSEPRLLIGPMSEQGLSVGAAVSLSYYASITDANAGRIANDQGNDASVGGVSGVRIAYNDGESNFEIGSASHSGDFQGNTRWTVIISDGSTIGTFNNTTILAPGYYFLYPVAPCFLEGTKILCLVDDLETYLPIEQMRPGTLVKTSRDGYKKVEVIGKGTIKNPGDSERAKGRLYKCPCKNYPQLTEDLYLTGCHSILVDTLTEAECNGTIFHLERIFVTDNKYRLLACVDERAEPWNSEGVHVIWNFALENVHDNTNYGVYANGGLLVETCCLRRMRENSNMELL